MGRRVKQEKGVKDPFGTCLPHATHLSCLHLRGLGRLYQTTARQKKKQSVHCFIVVDFPQL